MKFGQRANGLSGARSLETKIALYRFNARVRSGVGDIGARAQDRALFLFASLQVFIQALGVNFRLVDVEISVAEARVG